MAIQIGQQLGSLEVTALIGKGGMGEVYRARDSKLKRDVAIKILPEEFSRDTDRISRFQREAEVLASLSHPNIAGIFDLQQTDEMRFLVLELVEGETLADRISRGPVSIEEALQIGRSICEALEAAHEKGIVHRDLKPANVKITPDGKVKVLDFGLAKAREPSPSGRGQSEGSNSPTLFSVAASNAGMILGTAAYMSPEQAKGASADARSDLFSFGCVLYEMLTGRQAFEGDTVSEILASILVREPDFAALPEGLNPRLYELLKRCLEKNPRRRWHCAGDLRSELETVSANLDYRPETAAASAPKASRFWQVTAILIAVLAVALGILYIYRAPQAAAVGRFFVSPPEKTTFMTGGRAGTSVAISPDGHKLAFTAADEKGKVMLWLRGIDSLTAQPVAGTDGANFPFWSPDSRYIAYFTQDKLMKVDVFGGPPQTICNALSGRGGTWSPKGVIVFGAQNASLNRVSSAGGQPVAFTKPIEGQADQRFPSFLPDGENLLVLVGGSAEVQGVYVTNVTSGTSKRLFNVGLDRASSAPIYAAPGYLLFGRDGTLIAQSFDPTTLQLSGEPFPIAEHIEATVFGGIPAFSVSNNGILAYGTGLNGTNFGDTQLVWLDRQGKQIEVVGSPGSYRGIDLSPDGKTIVAHRHEANGGDIWLLDWARGTSLRFTFDATRENESPIWSPDGKRIMFAAGKGAKWAFYQKESTGAGNEEPVLELQALPESWSPDGQYVVYATLPNPKTQEDLWLLPLSGNRKPVPLAAGPGIQRYGQISPDGKWLAYQSDETGRPEIYVIPFPSGAGKWQISNNGGNWPRWRHDGRELFFNDSGTAKLASVDIKAVGSTLLPGTPKDLFSAPATPPNHPGGPYMPYAVSSDGQRFLVSLAPSQVTETPATSPIVVVLNWLEDLKQRAPVK